MCNNGNEIKTQSPDSKYERPAFAFLWLSPDVVTNVNGMSVQKSGVVPYRLVEVTIIRHDRMPDEQKCLQGV